MTGWPRQAWAFTNLPSQPLSLSHLSIPLSLPLVHKVQGLSGSEGCQKVLGGMLLPESEAVLAGLGLGGWAGEQNQSQLSCRLPPLVCLPSPSADSPEDEAPATYRHRPALQGPPNFFTNTYQLSLVSHFQSTICYLLSILFLIYNFYHRAL